VDLPSSEDVIVPSAVLALDEASTDTMYTSVAPRSRSFLSWHTAVPFALSHVAIVGAVWTGVRWQDIVCCAVLYFLRMFAVTGGYHRYFSHRAYKTSRVGAFILGFLAESSAQKGILWWAMHHRAHHRYADTDKDPHSPVRDGFWYAHFGWLYVEQNDSVSYRKVPDLARYPELTWLDRLWIVPPLLLGFGVWALLGWSGLWIGFFLSTVLLWHATFCINSAAHLFGRRRYATPDTSRNNWLLAIFTFGEGWHNNHHKYPTAARQGLRWWEIDITYYILEVLSGLGVVWSLRPPHGLAHTKEPLIK